MERRGGPFFVHFRVGDGPFSAHFYCHTWVEFLGGRRGSEKCTGAGQEHLSQERKIALVSVDGAARILHE